MNALTRDSGRWFAAGIGAALVGAAFVALFSHTTVAVMPLASPALRPAIVLGPGRSEALAMRDLAPLFLPTPFNAAPKTARPAQPGRAFFDNDPGQHTLFSEDNPQLVLPPVVTPPATPAAALTLPPPPLAAGFGRTNSSVPVLPATGGRVDVYAGGGGSALLGVTLPASAAPARGGAGGAWQPLEFSAAIGPAGLVDSLVLTRSSGAEEIDAYFRNYLASQFHLGDRLPPGFYRVVVAP